MKQPDVTAEVTFLTEQDGGRRSPVPNPFGAVVCFGQGYWDARFHFLGPVVPDEPVRAEVRFLSPQCLQEATQPGRPFLIREGIRTVGLGVVVKLVGA